MLVTDADSPVNMNPLNSGTLKAPPRATLPEIGADGPRIADELL